MDQKHTAFDDVLGHAVRFGEYNFPVAVAQSQSTTFAPVLLQSVAGVESDWTHYRNGQTNYNPRSCDFGLMQINEVAQAGLFAKQPSLRADTRANIAASAQTLSELWARGLFETLPLVNDGDPSWLPNWYYVLSSYNGGPGSGVWVNNPACGSANFPCEKDYTGRRPREAATKWMDATKDNYPYQERVLNNLPLPLALAQHPQVEEEPIREWLAEGLGIKEYTAQADSGLFPEDSIFVRPNPTTGALESYAPNLILFRHRTLPLYPDVNVQTIAFEYDLPFSAQVTVTLVLQDGSELPLCAHAGEAGWNQLYCRAEARLQNGDAYRIRAERGDPEQPAGYYLGHYLQSFIFTDQPLLVQNLAYAVHLPLVQNIGEPVALFNRNFSLTDPRAGWKPDYWDVQAIASRKPAGLTDISRLMGRTPAASGWLLRAAPGAVVDMRQRITLEPGRYLLRVQLDLQGRDAASVLTIRTRPAAPGPQPWTLVANIEAAGSGPQDNQYWLQLDGPATISLLAVFAPEDAQSALILRSVELFR